MKFSFFLLQKLAFEIAGEQVVELVELAGVVTFHSFSEEFVAQLVVSGAEFFAAAVLGHLCHALAAVAEHGCKCSHGEIVAVEAPQQLVAGVGKVLHDVAHELFFLLNYGNVVGVEGQKGIDFVRAYLAVAEREQGVAVS